MLGVKTDLKPTDIEITNTMIIHRGSPAIRAGSAVTGRITGCYFHDVGGTYVPPFFRRRRMTWAQPTVRRWRATRAAWRWSKP